MTDTRKPITARFSGHCANRACVTAFAAGTTVYWARGAGAICGLCHEAEAAPVSVTVGDATYEGPEAEALLRTAEARGLIAPSRAHLDGLAARRQAPAPAYQPDGDDLVALGDGALMDEFKALVRRMTDRPNARLSDALDAVHEEYLHRHPEHQAKTATDLLSGLVAEAIAPDAKRDAGETEAEAARKGWLWLGFTETGYGGRKHLVRGYVTGYGRTTRDGVKVPAVVLAGLGRFAQESHVYALTDLVERDQPYAREAYAAYVQAIKAGAEKSAALKAASLAVLEIQEAEAIDREVERQAEGR